MTVGIATPTDGISAWERAEQAAMDRAQRERELIDAGYATLGYQQAPRRENGVVVEYVWVRRHQERIDYLPAGVVDAARSAVSAEQAAREALLTKFAEARDYITKHRLSAPAANTHAELHAAEAATAHREASQATLKAMYRLGEAAEARDQWRRAEDAAPKQREAEEMRHLAALASIDSALALVKTAAERLGVQ